MSRLLFRFGLLLLLASSLPLTATLSSCASAKKEDPKPQPPQPTTGSLSGIISSWRAVAEVKLTDATGKTVSATPVVAESTASFTFKDLQPGSYTLSFRAVSFFATPAPRTVTIVAGQTTDVGTIVAETNGMGAIGGEASWTANGVAYSSSTINSQIMPPATGGAPVFMLSASTGTAAASQTVVFTIRNFDLLAGTYTYPIAPGYGSAAYYFHSNNAIVASYGNSSTGNFTIVSYDAATKVYTGTFAYTSLNDDRSGSAIAVTNGRFTLQY